MVINDSDLDPARIAAAATVIDPVFLHSPRSDDATLSRHLGRRILIKDETRNPLRFFKGRGADFLASGIGPGHHLVCASSGNFGHTMAYASRSHGHRCSVFLGKDSNPIAQERIRGLAAEVRLIEGDDAAVKQESQGYAAAAPQRILVSDGQDAAIAEGAGTIGLELLAAGALDAVIVPVGDVALISGVGCAIKRHAPATRVIGCAIKRHAPATRVIGVCPASARSMAASWRRGVPTRAPARTIANGLATVDPSRVRFVACEPSSTRSCSSASRGSSTGYASRSTPSALCSNETTGDRNVCISALHVDVARRVHRGSE